MYTFKAKASKGFFCELLLPRQGSHGGTAHVGNPQASRTLHLMALGNEASHPEKRLLSSS